MYTPELRSIERWTRSGWPAQLLVFGVLVALLVGCGEGVPALPDAPLTLDTGVGDVEPDVSLFTPCDDNTDCVGGEVCREGDCRESCGADDPCVGVLGTCELELGYCVECLSEAECDRDERCEANACVFHCSGDASCELGFHCDESGGACVENECNDDDECRGGYRCDEGICASIDALICEPDAGWCDENDLVLCSGDGTSEERIDCGDEPCIEDEDGARCTEMICEPFGIGCVDLLTAFSCEGTGTVRHEFPCAEQRYCEEGACLDQICQPDLAECDGDVVVACDARGASVTTTTCADEDTCIESEHGCSCEHGACERRICRPGTGRCSANARLDCADDGLSYLDPTPCGEDGVCVAGSCLPKECEPGTTTCANDVLVECNGNGTERTETDCSAEMEICSEDDPGAFCEPRVCVPDAAACAPDRTAVVSCDSRGAEETRRECRSDQHCSGSACVPDLCDPELGDVCIGGDVKRCDPTGVGYSLVEDCEAGTEHCHGGSCEEIVCEGGTAVCDVGTLVECDENGLNETRTNCTEDSRYCHAESRSCLPWTCTPGQVQCAPNEILQRCNSDGSQRDDTDCRTSSRICVESGETVSCQSQVCEPSSATCDASRTAVLTCDARGSAASRLPCREDQHCSDGACREDVCDPSAGAICTDGDVKRCDEIGSQLDLVDDCGLGTQLCVEGACESIVCDADSSRCSGDVLFECSANGLDERRTDCIDDNSYCDSASPRCVPWECTPGEDTCDGNNAVVCDGQGRIVSATTCSATLGCAAGQCVVGCGDGVLQTGEECDDSNLADWDGCDPHCQYGGYRDSQGAEYARILPGAFTMGSPDGELGRNGDEASYQVTITRPFYLQQTEVTQSQWVGLVGRNPSLHQECGSDCPLDTINWYEAVTYANLLSVHEDLAPCYVMNSCTGVLGGGCEEGTLCDGDYRCGSVTFVGLDCEGYRLPTEAEWEYAYRAGTTTPFFTGEITASGPEADPNLEGIAWYGANAGGVTHAREGRAANPWGIYDLPGNVWEWVWDGYDEYPTGNAQDPAGANDSETRAMRGGFWESPAIDARAATRGSDPPTERNYDRGLRVARTIVAHECGDLGCEVAHRSCNDGEGSAVCGACLAGYTDIEGTCVEVVCQAGKDLCVGRDVHACNATGTAHGLSTVCSDTLGCLDGLCVIGCGDGVTDPVEEECDDGNLEEGDGCDQNCQREPTPGVLIISELVDGAAQGGYPKWVELTNVGEQALDLSSFSLGLYRNGATTLTPVQGTWGESFALPLHGSLRGCNGYVVGWESFDVLGTIMFSSVFGTDPSQIAALGSAPDGEDVVALFLGQPTVATAADSLLVDVYGEVGVAEGAWAWTGGYARRLAHVDFQTVIGEGCPSDGAGGWSGCGWSPTEWDVGRSALLGTGSDSASTLLRQLTTPYLHTTNSYCR